MHERWGHARFRQDECVRRSQADWGGQLRVFPDACPDNKRSLDTLPVEDSVDILPEGGTLVLLRSPSVPHEVCVTRRERQCVVGWFRSLRSRR